jgi:hypothetical protein
MAFQEKQLLTGRAVFCVLVGHLRFAMFRSAGSGGDDPSRRQTLSGC